MNLIFALWISLSAAHAPAAVEGVLECLYSDGTLSYRDRFEVSPAGIGSYLAEVALLWNMEYKKACWSDGMKAIQAEGQLAFDGEVECVDGGKGVLKQTLNLSTMKIEGTWRGAYPCRWIQNK